MPWTVSDPPRPAKNWPRADKEKCVKAANAVLRKGGTDRDAIFACIRAAGRSTKEMTELIETIENVDISVTEDKDDGYHYATFLVSQGNQVNRNSRVYPTPIWRREAVRLAQEEVTGQAGHPGFFAQTNPLDQLLLFTKGYVENKNFYATARVIPTSQGQDFVKIVQAGVKLSVSTRGNGAVKKVEKWTDDEGTVHRDVAVVQDDYKLRGIDVLLRGDQSVQGANLIRFEAIGDDDMEKLEELTAELEAKDAALNEAQEKLEETQQELNEAKAERSGALAHAEELQEQVVDKDGTIKLLKEKSSLLEEELEGKNDLIVVMEDEADTRDGEVKSLTEYRDALKSRLEARSYLLGRVVGEPLAMPLLKELWDATSPEAVDSLFEGTRQKVMDDLAGQDTPGPDPKGVIKKQSGDDLEEGDDEELRPGVVKLLKKSGMA